MRVKIFRSVLFVISSITFVPATAFVQRTLSENMGMEKGFFHVWFEELVYGSIGWFAILGFLALLLMSAAIVLLVFSFSSFEVDDGGGLIIPENSIYSRIMALVYRGAWNEKRDGCSIYWLTVLLLLLFSVTVILLIFASPLVLNWIMNLKTEKIIELLIGFGFLAAFILGLMAIFWTFDLIFNKSSFGEFVKTGISAAKNGSCPRVTFKKTS